jgi:ABC-type multidrug transport system ATPase subunit
VKQLRKQGMTILYTTHYMEEVEEISTRIIIMDLGNIIAEGTNESLKAGAESNDASAETVSLETVFLQLTGKSLRN